VPGADGSPGGRISGSLPSGGLHREQLFSGAAEGPGRSSSSCRINGVRKFMHVTSDHRMPGGERIYSRSTVNVSLPGRRTGSFAEGGSTEAELPAHRQKQAGAFRRADQRNAFSSVEPTSEKHSAVLLGKELLTLGRRTGSFTKGGSTAGELPAHRPLPVYRCFPLGRTSLAEIPGTLTVGCAIENRF